MFRFAVRGSYGSPGQRGDYQVAFFSNQPMLKRIPVYLISQGNAFRLSFHPTVFAVYPAIHVCCVASGLSLL